MKKISHVITDLSTGGAEVMLYKLLSVMDRTAFATEVISLTDIGPVGEKVKDLGIPVRELGMRRGVPSPAALLKLAGLLRESRPDLVQTWMYHADLIGSLAAGMSNRIPVVWGIHNCDLNPLVTKKSTIWTVRICAKLSGRLPDRIICCSEASMVFHRQLGYAPEKLVVIPNGIDLLSFRPDPAARLSVREELGIPAETLLIGLVGRFNPQKDHLNFIRAASLLYARFPEVRFLLCGDGITWENQELAGWIKAAGIYGNCHLLGRRDDIPRLQAALDIAVSSSRGEAFALVVGEAMACGVPCVVTNVGEMPRVVGDTGRIVDPENHQALAGACMDLIEAGPGGRAQLGAAARRRVEKHFNLLDIVERYENLYSKQLAIKSR